MYGNLYLEYNSLVSLVMQNKAEKVIDLLETESMDMRTLLDYWDKRWNYPVNRPMDFSYYQEMCAHFKDWDMDELLEGNLDDLVASGYNKDEVELCYAVLTYRPDLIRKHILLRTNPDVYISGNITPGTGYSTDGVDDFMEKCRFQASILMKKCMERSLIRWKKCDEFDLFA